MTPNTRKYLKISLPEDLVKVIDEVRKKSNLAYRSRAEFIVEAIREKLQSLGLLRGESEQYV